MCISEDECASKTLRVGTIKECITECRPTEYFVLSDDKKYCYN